jgi:hypothetical protein
MNDRMTFDLTDRELRAGHREIAGEYNVKLLVRPRTKYQRVQP